MRALVLHKNGGLELETDRPTPTAAGEALIRLRLGGVCATDLELCKGFMGFEGVLGHEWVGVVESAPDSTWQGKRVVGDINCPCGRCGTCAAKRQTHCPNRTVLGILGRDGAFSEHFRLPLENLHVVPDGVADEAAVFVEPLAAACRILEQVRICPSDRVVVVGLGRLGQLCARVLALTGAKVTGLSRTTARLDLLPQGISGTTDPDSVTGADVVVDCTGNPDGLALASRIVRPMGTIVLKTTTHGLGQASPTDWVINEVTVVGSRCGPFAPALRMLAQGLVDPRPLISARLPLDEGVEALARAAEPGTVKVLLNP